MTKMTHTPDYLSAPLSGATPGWFARANNYLLSPTQAGHARRFLVLSAVFFFVLALCVFGNILVRGGPDTVLSRAGNDMTTFAVPYQVLGYQELRHGHITLWNPHVYAGSAYIGNMNCYILYPLNFYYLFVPLNRAININFALHFFLAGWFTALWAWYRGTSPVGSLLAGTALMFSGPLYLHLYPGHIYTVDAFAWAPIVFLCIDGILRDQKLHWPLLGMFAVAMQVLAGFPQTVYYTALLAGLYTAMHLIRCQHRVRVAGLALLIYLGGPLLCAIQLFIGMATAGESVRAHGTTMEFAGMTSLPPENFLTMLVPCLFGDLSDKVGYFGRSYPWEVHCFAGVTTLLLGVWGIFLGARSSRRWPLVVLLVVACVLMLGAYVPIYPLLYKYLPLYGSFRSTARFNFYVALFLALLAGVGFDRVVERRTWSLTVLCGTAALTMVILGGLLRQDLIQGAQSTWAAILASIAKQHDLVFLSPAFYADPVKIVSTGMFASVQIALCAGTFAVLAAMGALLRVWRPAAYGLLALCLGEMFLFAWCFYASGPAELPYPAYFDTVREQTNPDARSLHPNFGYANRGTGKGYDDVYGYDPVIFKRYAEFLGYTQIGFGVALDPRVMSKEQDGGALLAKGLDQLNFAPPMNWLSFDPVTLTNPQGQAQTLAAAQVYNQDPRGLPRYLPFFQLLRCNTVFLIDPPRGKASIMPLSDPMPRLFLLSNYQLLKTRDEILPAMTAPAFDPRKTVILETKPQPEPEASSAPGTVSLVRSSTDSLEIQADIAAPCILLITDSYSAGWRVRPLGPGPQLQYDLLPADYTFRAIPLAKGNHHFLVEYAPRAYTVGKWVSVGAWGVWIVAGLWALGVGRRANRSGTQERLAD